MSAGYAVQNELADNISSRSTGKSTEALVHVTALAHEGHPPILRDRIHSWIRMQGVLSKRRIYPRNELTDTYLQNWCIQLSVRAKRSTSESTPAVTSLSEALNCCRDVTPLGSSDEIICALQCQITIRIVTVFNNLHETSDDDDEEDCHYKMETKFNVKRLPHVELVGLWESLHYEKPIKKYLMNFVRCSQVFGQSNVNPQIVSWSRLILLHGPPGTGKTSLAHGLAQQLATIEYPNPKVYLVEIDCHSLLSKWFGESCKLISNLFEFIVKKLSHKKNCLQCICCHYIVIFDEVESLLSSRHFNSSSEPMDASRMVNSFLSSLDKIKFNKNITLISTSNFIEAIDHAFLDRVDLNLFVPLPGLLTRRLVLTNCLKELVRARLIKVEDKEWQTTSKDFQTLCQDITKGFSGRALRKLPFLTYCRRISSNSEEISQNTPPSTQCSTKSQQDSSTPNLPSIEAFCNAMCKMGREVVK